MQYEECSFALDVLACPRCGGRLRVIATVEDPVAVRQILAARRPAETLGPGPPAPAGAPAMAIKGMTTDSAGTRATVTALSTYESKYFNPRFLEHYVFGTLEGRWVVNRLVMVPVYPSKPELHRVQILVGEYANKGSFRSSIEVALVMLENGPDAIVDTYLTNVGKTYPADHGGRPVLYLFREPPRPGATVRIEEVHLSERGEIYFTTARDFPVRESTPYFFIYGHAFGNFRSNQSIWCTVSVDGTRVHKEILRVR